MSYLIARTYNGGKDLYHGVPDLMNGKIINVVSSKTNDDYVTELEIQSVNGNIHTIAIVQKIE